MEDCFLGATASKFLFRRDRESPSPKRGRDTSPEEEAAPTVRKVTLKMLNVCQLYFPNIYTD